ncbi:MULTISPECIES: DUF982 domain-containing protein [unclassified Rhizobium]|jgi:hypothetical protein|uniref:DUF982 domain-containing protein n=1 Tax=unclassified Rhizobium TaxID=2613769 RepID=UPI00160F0329|nr:DUF982 domain-containing protein [Rhizobium sp. UBA1881]
MNGMHEPIPIAPLHVDIEGAGRYVAANNVENIAALLISVEWPNKTPPAFHRALVTSLEALDHSVSPAQARAAFVDAAHAAGMHVIPDDMSEIKKAS